MVGEEGDVKLFAAVEEGVEDGVGVVGGGEELAGLFLFEIDAEGFEPADGLVFGEVAEDVPDDGARAVVVFGGDAVVGDVAAATSRDAHFREALIGFF